LSCDSLSTVSNSNLCFKFTSNTFYIIFFELWHFINCLKFKSLLQVDKQYLLYHILWAVTFYQLSQIQIFNFFLIESALNLLFTKIFLRHYFILI
jgi:hypothetical protein